MRIFFTVCICCLCCVIGFAQDAKIDSASFSAKISVAGSYNAGNFQKVGLNNMADLTLNTRNNNFGFLSHTQYTYTKTFGVIGENDFLSRTLFYRRLYNRWSAIGIFWFETNKLRQIQPLLQLGGAIGYSLLLKKKNSAGVSLGATFEHKHFQSDIFENAEYNGSRNITTPRLFLRVHGSNSFGISKIALDYDLYYMPSLKFSNNYRYHAEASLSVPVVKHLNLQTSFQYNYENIVIAGIKPNDFFTAYGISCTF